MNKVIISILCCFFTLSLSASDSALHKTVNDLAKRISRIEKLPHVGRRGFFGDVVSFATAHPVLTTTAAVTAVCYSQRSRALIRTGWGWLTASAEYFLGKDSWTVAGMHAVGFAADKAEVALKELNGEASQEAVLGNLQQQLAASSHAVGELQKRLISNERQYQHLVVESANINKQLLQTADTLETMTAQLSQVQQDELAAKLRAKQLETEFEGKYSALQQRQSSEFQAIVQNQRSAVETMNQQLQTTKTTIAELRQSIERLTTQLTTQIRSHTANCDRKTQIIHDQLASFDKILKNLEQQEAQLQAGLKQMIINCSKSSEKRAV